MIKVKNSQLNNETLSVINNLIEMDIKASEAFKLSRIIRHLSMIVEDKILSEKKIYNKWIQKDEFGNIVKPMDEFGNEIKNSINIIDVEKFSSEMSDLMSVENCIPYEKINFEDMCLEKAKIKDILKIDFLFN